MLGVRRRTCDTNKGYSGAKEIQRQEKWAKGLLERKGETSKKENTRDEWGRGAA